MTTDSARGVVRRASANRLIAFLGADLALLLIALLTHGLALLNDGVFWDDWLWTSLYSTNRTALIREAFGEMGSLPWNTAYFLVAIRAVWISRVVVFCSFVSIALLVRRCARRSGLFTAPEAFLIAATSV